MRRTEAINICWHHLSQSDEHGSLARSKAALKILVFPRIRNSKSDLCESRRPQLIPKPNQASHVPRGLWNFTALPMRSLHLFQDPIQANLGLPFRTVQGRNSVR